MFGEGAFGRLEAEPEQEGDAHNQHSTTGQCVEQGIHNIEAGGEFRV